MMQRGNKLWLINLLAALAISIVINFSYLLLILVDDQPKEQVMPAGPKGDHPRRPERQLCRGTLHIVPDGHGYLLCELCADSVYVSQQRIERFSLQAGDTLSGEAMQPRNPHAHASLIRLNRINGKEFEPPAVRYHRPKHSLDFGLQLLYYLLLSLLLNTILTARGERYNFSQLFYLRRLGICLLVVVPLYFVAPKVHMGTGNIMLNFMSDHLLDFMILLRCSFAVVVSLLYGYLYALLRRSRSMALENEHLKNENLTSRYNMLVSQINPHFFFNSLSSLSMLVREKNNEMALEYIDRLSYTFRYILQNGQAMLVTLDEELRFAEAYSYLFQARYADKLFFDIQVDDHLRNYCLPALSLQPLMGNAVKHNTITRQNPLHVTIRTEGEQLVVENPRRPKLDPEPGMGIGLKNLNNRWELITGSGIVVEESAEWFRVRLPLTKNLKA